jgi:hypothetical protein
LTASIPKSDSQNQTVPQWMMKKQKTFSNFQNRAEAYNDKTLKRTESILDSQEETKKCQHTDHSQKQEKSEDKLQK